ncbi:MAG: hypothetical protein ACRD0N_03555 [Acidimicrobiales bacterium]
MTLRRTLLALCGAGLVAGVLRLRGATARPPAPTGGWRELSGPDLR